MKLVKTILTAAVIVAVILSLGTSSSAQIVQSGSFTIDLDEVERGSNPPVNPGTDDELLSNSGFETGSFTPWYHDGAWSISTHNPHAGTYCAYDIGNHWVRQDISPTPAADIVSATLWMRQPEAAISAIDFFYSNLPYSEDIIWVSANWEQYNVTSFIEPGGIVTAIRIYGYSGGGALPDETFLDDVSIQTFGMPEVTITLTPATFPIYLPPEGGTFDYNVEIANIGTGTANFQAWTEAHFFMPDTMLFGPLLLRNLSIGIGGMISRDMTQFVPAAAPDGSYFFIGKIGTFPLAIIDVDSFQFNKGIYSDGTGEPVMGWECAGWDETPAEVVSAPEFFSLEAVFPNPFNIEANLSYTVGMAGDVSMKVYDVNGRLIAEIVSGYHPAGRYNARWNAGKASSGVYFFQITSSEGVSVQKGILLK